MMERGIPEGLPGFSACLRAAVSAAALLALAAPACEQQAGPATEEQEHVEAPSPAEEQAAAAPQEEVEAPVPASQGGLPSLADVVERARPAVINIYTRQKVRPARAQRHPLFGHPVVPPERERESLGSGFLISSDGLALTNNHVVQGASDIEVRLLDERRFKARIIGTDPKTDIALIQIEEASGLPHLELAGADDPMRVGDWVVAIGNPLGLSSTVTAGVVSATGRAGLPLGNLRYQDFIQTDASINPGNSGGPLINLDGEVVGINTAVSAEGQGIGFAIPARMVRTIVPKLREHGRVERSWLGIYVDEIPGALRRELGLPVRGGALVRGVVRGGQAELATLRQGDVILLLGGQEVRDADHLSWLAANVGVGKEVDVDVRRGSEELVLTIRMGALPN